MPGEPRRSASGHSGEAQNTQIDRRLWSDFSFVASSRYREKVISSLAAKPKLPKQLAEEMKLRPVHVSRALRELDGRGLVECLTPSASGRGRLYGLTRNGSALFAYLQSSSQRFSPFSKGVGGIGFVPKIRGEVVLRSIRYLMRAKGEATVRDALKDWSVNLEGLTDVSWLSADAFDEFHELVEAKFGDGSYEFIRSLYAHVIPSVSTIRFQILQAIPLTALAERAPVVYGKEWNYGRLEVRTGRRRALFLHYDWMPTPAFCALFQGTYEGILKARGVNGRVAKTRCVRMGDDRCEYVVEW